MRKLISCLNEFWDGIKSTYFWIFQVDNEMIKMIKEEENKNK